jgi:hypothetical protein
MLSCDSDEEIDKDLFAELLAVVGWEGNAGDVLKHCEWAEVSTLAGGVSGINSAHIDAFGTNAGFNNPIALAVDASGNVFVADFNNQRIRKVTAGGGTWISPVTLRACDAEIDINAAFPLPQCFSLALPS